MTAEQRYAELVDQLGDRPRVTLAAAGDGRRFDPGHGRLMREWLSVEPTTPWLPLAIEALAFVGLE